MLKRIQAIVALAALTVSTNSIAHDHANATYLGNAGIMVAKGETKILFDAFYASTYNQYALVPDDILEPMMSGTPPYDGVDAIFVSHVHGDHFTAENAIAYLMAHEAVHLYGPQQVVDAFVEAGVDENHPLFARIHGFTLTPEDEGVSFEIDDIDVDAVSIPHAGNRPTIQNYAWRISIGEDTSVIHLGDAGPVKENFDRHQRHFDQKTTHTAFPPYWFIGDTDGEAILSDIIKADQSVGVHVPARFIGGGPSARRATGGDLFTDPGEERIIGAPSSSPAEE